MKTNYRQQKKLKEKVRLTRQAEKRQRRTGDRAVERDAPTADERAVPAKPAT